MKKKSIFISLFFLFISTISFAQNDDSWKVYEDSEIAVIKISVDPSDLQYMYDNPHSDSLHLAQIHFKNSQINEVIDSVGFRIRGATSRESSKKSFKLSFNTFIKGQDFHSLEKMNLNGEHNDPSIVRSKLCWDFFNSIGMISTRASHAAIHINNEYYGLYISIEHIDDEFLQKNFTDDSGNLWKCLFGSDLVYLGENPDLYKFENISGDVPYRLVTNEEVNDYSKLAELINIINNTSNANFESAIENIIDVNSVLKYFAANVVVGGWDDYWSLSNNFYLYHNPSIDKFTLIPYDYDNTFGVTFWTEFDWETVNPYSFGKVFDGPRPLIEKLLSFPQYRNLYSHYLDYYANNIFNTEQFYSRLIELRTKIQAYAELDPFRERDWGFSKQDFLSSFDTENFSFVNGIRINNSIKYFIINRTNSLNTQINYIEHPPIIYDLNISSDKLQPDESLSIEASVFTNRELVSVKAELTINDETPISYNLSYTPSINSSLIEKADLWSINIPPFGASKKILLKIIAEDNLGDTSSFSMDGIEIVTASENVAQKIIITEVMSSNNSTIMDQNSEYDDWIEIYNPQDTSVNLSGMFLTDKKDNLSKWNFPQDMVIAPKEYKILWCDEDQEQGINHTNFKLSSNGEYVALVYDDGISIIDSISFPALMENESYARQDDMINWSKTSTPTPGQNNIITSIENSLPNIHSIDLKVYPNPFNPATNIEYEITKPQNVELKIFDVLGREVWNKKNENKSAGKYTVHWNGVDKNGRELATGIYLLNINANAINKTIKIMLLR